MGITEIFKSIWTSVSSIAFNDIIEIIILTFVIYKGLMLIKNTRTWFLLKGIVAIVIFYAIAKLLQLNTILYLIDRALDVILIALVVVFQPELRALLERIGKGNVFKKLFKGSHTDTGVFSRETSEELVKSAVKLSETKTGALIVIEREDPMTEYINTGIKIDAVVSNQLMINIFEHNTPLHDGAVVIQKNRVVAATCYLPLSSSNINKSFGTRHRAGLGLSEVSDALVLIVSEETGHISVATGGKLKEGLSHDELRTELEVLISKDVETKSLFRKSGRAEDEKETVE